MFKSLSSTLAAVAIVTTFGAASAVAHDAQVRGAYASQERGGQRGWQQPAYEPDTVGSLARDSQGRYFNRFNGQRYGACMIDEGYGRVRTCDGGQN